MDKLIFDSKGTTISNDGATIMKVSARAALGRPPRLLANPPRALRPRSSCSKSCTRPPRRWWTSPRARTRRCVSSGMRADPRRSRSSAPTPGGRRYHHRGAAGGRVPHASQALHRGRSAPSAHHPRLPPSLHAGGGNGEEDVNQARPSPCLQRKGRVRASLLGCRPNSKRIPLLSSASRPTTPPRRLPCCVSAPRRR